MNYSLSLYLFISITSCVFAIYQWSFQQKLTVPSAGKKYGSSSYGLVGRGFTTLISGYSEDNSSIYIHTTDSGDLHNGRSVWSQQARLSPKDAVSTDGFGSELVFHNQTIIVSSPFAKSSQGRVYIFNGTLRHWSQIQKLEASDGGANELFGETLALHGNRLLIGAKGAAALTIQTTPIVESAGAAYVYERPANGLYWSRQGKLNARDAGTGYKFAEKIALYKDTAVMSATNDLTYPYSYESYSGSAYIFQGSGAKWSQQQKLISEDFQHYRLDINPILLDLSLGNRYLGPSLAVNKDTVTMGIINNHTVNHTLLGRESVYVFKYSSSTSRWSLQQKLFAGNDTIPFITYNTDVYMDKNNTLIASILSQTKSIPSLYPTTSPAYASFTSPLIKTSYIFKTYNNGWSLQQKLQTYNKSELYDPYVNISTINDDLIAAEIEGFGQEPSIINFTHPQLYGGYLLFGGSEEVQIRSQYQNNSCLRIWLSDHFLDGWDTAVLTVRAPDLTNDTFHPHCDQ
eukprot:gene12234-16390_t